MAEQPTYPYVFILCYAAGDSGADLVLVRRQLLVKWADGRPIRGVIPSWAGQWGVFADRPRQSKMVEQAAYAAFLAQTGINLADSPTAQRYGFIGNEVKNLQDSGYNPVPVLCAAFTPPGLRALLGDIQANIAARKIADGVVLEAEIKRQAEASALIGPVKQPPEGWRSYLVQNYYDGKPPGQLNTEIDALTAEMALRATEPSPGFDLAIENTPKSVAPPPAKIPRLVELKVSGAEQSPAGVWYQAYSPDQSIRIQAVTDPPSSEAQGQIVWRGGVSDPTGYPALRCVPLNAITPFGTFLTVEATLGEQNKSARVAVAPNLVSLDISDAYAQPGDQWGLDAENKDKPAVVRAVVEPDTEDAYKYLKWTGGKVDPVHPYDRRMVTFEEVVRAGSVLPVEVELNLG